MYIFGPWETKDGFWRIQTNYELDQLIHDADTVEFIKNRTLEWLGHGLTQMDDTKIADWKPTGRRIRERPRKRWTDDVQDDLESMNVRGQRRRLCGERTEWEKITEHAKTHTGL